MSDEKPDWQGKKLTEANLQEYAEALRHSGWYSKLRSKLYSDHVGIPIQNVLSITQRISEYEHILIAAAFEDFCKEAGYIRGQSFKVWDDDISAPEYINIEIEPEVFKRGWGEGNIFLKTPNGESIVVEMASSGSRLYTYEVLCRKEGADAAQKFLNDSRAYAKSHNFLKGKKINPAFKHIKLDRKYTWDDVILPEKVKKELKLNIDSLFNNIEAYKKAELPFKRGIMLKGVPGTGKTLIGKILCSTVGCSFVWVTPRFVREAKDVSDIYELVRDLSPAILFLEDMDLYTKHREQSTDMGLLGELMNQLDGLTTNEYVVTIATTNRAEQIEEALRSRPGRFDRSYEIKLPEATQREALLKLYINRGDCVCDLTELDYKALADATDGMTGSHVRELVTTAIISAIDDKSYKKEKIHLTRRHFEESVKRVKKKKNADVGFKSPADLSPVESESLRWKRLMDDDYDY